MSNPISTQRYEFDRYVDGVLKAEGICISRAHSLPEACAAAARMASRGDVLVLRTPDETSAPRYPHWHCNTHGDFDARVAVGCPECVREMRARLATPYACPECKIEAGFHELTCSRWKVDETTRAEVAGDRLGTSLAMFQHKCSVHIAAEQGKPNSDNALIDTLCEAIRLCRENEQLARSPVKTSTDPTHQHAEGCPKLSGGECACDPVPL